MAVKARPMARNFKYGLVGGRFAVGATGAVGAKTGDDSGALWTVARTAVGTYEVTLTRVPSKLIAADATVRKTTGADLKSQLVSITESTGKVKFRFQAVGTDTEVANGDDVTFWIMIQP